MFSNFAWSEMLVIACVAILVVGPKDLPGMLRQLGKTIGNVKRMASDFQRQFNDAINEAELNDIKSELNEMTSSKGFAPLEDAKRSMEEFTKTVNDSVKADAEAGETPAVAEEAASKTAKKPAAKKAPAKKTSAATKTTAAKTSARKPAAAARKPAARKTPAKKPAAGTTRKTTTTAKKPAAASKSAS